MMTKFSTSITLEEDTLNHAKKQTPNVSDYIDRLIKTDMESEESLTAIKDKVLILGSESDVLNLEIERLLKKYDHIFAIQREENIVRMRFVKDAKSKLVNENVKDYIKSVKRIESDAPLVMGVKALVSSEFHQDDVNNVLFNLRSDFVAAGNYLSIAHLTKYYNSLKNKE